MKIDCADNTDLNQIIELRHKAFLRLAPEFYNPVEVKNLLADYDTDQLHNMIAAKRLFCIRRNGDICGTSGWDEDCLRHLYVEPEYFGQKIGSTLLEAAIADFKARTPHKTIWAGVILYARGFYEKCGFQVSSKNEAWDGSEYYLMRRDVDQTLHCSPSAPASKVD